MRACFSGACFVAAYPRETQQAFLEAHVQAFDFFGGCFQPSGCDVERELRAFAAMAGLT